MPRVGNLRWRVGCLFQYFLQFFVDRVCWGEGLGPIVGNHGDCFFAEFVGECGFEEFLFVGAEGTFIRCECEDVVACGWAALPHGAVFATDGEAL